MFGEAITEANEGHRGHGKFKQIRGGHYGDHPGKVAELAENSIRFGKVTEKCHGGLGKYNQGHKGSWDITKAAKAITEATEAAE